MKIITYSDLHLEFGNKFKPPKDSDADLMILAGDVLTFNNFEPLKQFLADWAKPVLFVAGNHEYYTKRSMLEGEEKFFEFIKSELPNIFWLLDDSITFGNVEFFGGTMWTNFAHSPLAMMDAKRDMTDYRYIFKNKTRKLRPEDTVEMHTDFKEKLITWLEENKDKKRVVISHHAPVIHQNTHYPNSPLQPAFVSLDMVDIIEEYQPEIWYHGHTHQCDDQMIGKTRIISNQFGYVGLRGNAECKEFDSDGMLTEI